MKTMMSLDGTILRVPANHLEIVKNELNNK